MRDRIGIVVMLVFGVLCLTGCGQISGEWNIPATEITRDEQETADDAKAVSEEEDLGDKKSTAGDLEETGTDPAEGGETTAQAAGAKKAAGMAEDTTEQAEEVKEPAQSEFVKVADYIPDIVIDLKYATKDNFTGQVIYPFTDAYLRYGTVIKLQKVQAALKEKGMGLKIWDGFRPVSAQFALWEVCPDPVYVANPNTGYSSHSRGGTVDLTLVYADGTEVEMPTGFDDFSKRADRDYSDCSEALAENARFLENTMTAYGFTPYFGEWWHYSDTDGYPVETEFEP